MQVNPRQSRPSQQQSISYVFCVQSYFRKKKLPSPYYPVPVNPVWEFVWLYCSVCQLRYTFGQLDLNWFLCRAISLLGSSVFSNELQLYFHNQSMYFLLCNRKLSFWMKELWNCFFYDLIPRLIYLLSLLLKHVCAMHFKINPFPRNELDVFSRCTVVFFTSIKVIKLPEWKIPLKKNSKMELSNFNSSE